MKTINTYIYNIKHIKNYINEKLRLSAKPQYTCQPKDPFTLRAIIRKRVEQEGPDCDLNDIDVSKIVDMGNVFNTTMTASFEDFNGDVSLWNVSNVKKMYFMFHGCKKFNCDLSKWDVSNVEDMNDMFRGCEQFKQDLSHWDVSNVRYMRKTFENCPTTPAWYDKDKWEND